jgi:hypothetical protein
MGKSISLNFCHDITFHKFGIIEAANNQQILKNFYLQLNLIKLVPWQDPVKIFMYVCIRNTVPDPLVGHQD